MIHMADLFFIMKRRVRRRGKDQERKVVLRCAIIQEAEEERPHLAVIGLHYI